jgi:hypothetical protein
MPQGPSKICLVLSRCADTLNSFEEMRQIASMIQERWIIGLTTPTGIGNIASLVHRIPERDLKRRIPQNDTRQRSCAGAFTHFGELPLGMLEKHIVVSQVPRNMSRRHLYRTRLHEIVLRGRTTAFTIGMKIENKPFKFVCFDLLSRDVGLLWFIVVLLDIVVNFLLCRNMIVSSTGCLPAMTQLLYKVVFVLRFDGQLTFIDASDISGISCRSFQWVSSAAAF